MPKRALVRDIAVVLAVKMVVIFAASFFVFGAKQRPVIDASSVEAHFLSSPAAQPRRPQP